MVSTGPQETRCRVSELNSFCESKIVKPAETGEVVQFPDKLISIVLNKTRNGKVSCCIGK